MNYRIGNTLGLSSASSSSAPPTLPTTKTLQNANSKPRDNLLALPPFARRCTALAAYLTSYPQMSSLWDAAMARIAHLSSDIVVDNPCLPPPPTRSLHRPRPSPRRSSLPRAASQASALLCAQTASLVSHPAITPGALAHLLPDIPELSAPPGSPPTRSTTPSAVPYFIHSSDAQQPHDNLILASRLPPDDNRAFVPSSILRAQKGNLRHRCGKLPT